MPHGESEMTVTMLRRSPIRSDCAGRWRGSLVILPLFVRADVGWGAYSVEPHIKVGLFQHSTLYKGFPAILVKTILHKRRKVIQSLFRNYFILVA